MLTNVCINIFLNDFRCDYHSRNRKVKNGSSLQEIIYVLACMIMLYSTHNDRDVNE